MRRSCEADVTRRLLAKTLPLCPRRDKATRVGLGIDYEEDKLKFDELH